ncbi:MAG: hypothetical protein JXR61_05570 [Prolixibacteraceae bacterium]|nr:hypothetical protein [Prolixibacteraceae bacterium]
MKTPISLAFPFTFLIILFLYSCNHKANQSVNETGGQVKPKDSQTIETKSVQKFPDLIPGEVELTDDCFGDIIELQGQQKTTDVIFEVRETQMLVKDSLLIVASPNGESIFMVFTLPDFKLIKSLGKMGRGPGEFQYPSLVPAENDDCLCYIYEKTNDHLFVLNKNLLIDEMPFKLADSQTKLFINDKQPVGFSPSEFIYAESIKGGKAIFDFKVQNDSAQNKMVFNLSFSESHKSWASYIGDFGANAEKQRAVYAYKYFKRLVFIDLKNNTSRVLNFNVGEAKKGNDAIATMSPENTTYYWGISTQKDYVYVLYSGRSPMEVSKEWQKKEYYIFVEKFDWNGNPVAKYRLNNWGYFCADDHRGKLYLASVNDARPFFEFDLNEEYED